MEMKEKTEKVMMKQTLDDDHETRRTSMKVMMKDKKVVTDE